MQKLSLQNIAVQFIILNVERKASGIGSTIGWRMASRLPGSSYLYQIREEHVRYAPSPDRGETLYAMLRGVGMRWETVGTDSPPRTLTISFINNWTLR